MSGELAKRTGVRGTQKWTPARRARVKRSLLTKYGPVCQGCFTWIDLSLTGDDPMGFTVDHIIPWSDGGTNEIENLQPMHWLCNQKRAGHIQ